MGDGSPGSEAGGTGEVVYPPPVDQLLALGDLRGEGAWRDYRQYGLGREQVPDLIRMATDPDLNWADSESAEVWAPIHAWRALGQLRAEEAIEPLLGLFEELDDSDWLTEDMPEVFGLLGPPAIPALATFLADKRHGLWPRVTASDSLEHISTQHPEARDACAAALARQLEAFRQDDETLNASLVLGLTKLRATEALPLIERAFAADAVDLTLMGDWEDVQIEFGAKAERDTPRPNYFAMMMEANRSERATPTLAPSNSTTAAQRRAEAAHKAKNRRKTVAQSRRRNRKRK